MRENGIQYAAFGLVWKEYGARLCSNIQDVADEVDRMLVQAVDGPDNGQELYLPSDQYDVAPVTVGTLFALFEQHGTDEPVGLQDDFADAVIVAKQFIVLSVRKAHARVEKQKRAGQIFAQAEDKRIMISEDYVGRNYFARYQEALCAVSPRTGDPAGEWGIGIVPLDANSMRGRIQFPQPWWGLRGQELQDVSGIAGAKFVHHSGDFMAVANSRKAAIEMAQSAIDQS